MASATRLRVALVGCGRIAHVHCSYLRDIPEVELVGACELAATDNGHWKAALPGGILYDLAPHPAYLVHGLVGNISSVQVVTRRAEGGRLRELRALVEGARALGSLTISLDTRPVMNR